MAQVIFNYEGNNIIIECNINDLMKNIINIFLERIKNEGNNMCYLYNGNKVNKE